MDISYLILGLALLTSIIGLLRNIKKRQGLLLFWVLIILCVASFGAQFMETSQAKQEKEEQDRRMEHLVQNFGKFFGEFLAVREQLDSISKQTEETLEGSKEAKDLTATVLDEVKGTRELLEHPEQVEEGAKGTETISFVFREYQTGNTISGLPVEFFTVGADSFLYIKDTTDTAGCLTFGIPSTFIHDDCYYTVLNQDYEQDGRYVSVSDLVKTPRDIYLRRRR